MKPDSQTTKSLAEALPEEINRVRVIQDHMKELRGMPNVIVEPQIMMMEAEIQAAIKSLVSGDVIEMIRCHQSLKEYNE